MKNEKVRTTRVSTIKQLVQVTEARVVEARKKDREIAFRGQAQSSWGLEPSLFRFAKRKLKARHLRQHIGKLRGFECEIFYLFSARMALQLGEDLSGWDYLFHMQHFSVPTRLLDWSDSPGKALWFACSPKESKGSEGSPTLWILDVSRLNNRSWGFAETVDPEYLEEGYKEVVANYDTFNFSKPVAIYPNFVNERMKAQTGIFTVFGNNTAPLDQQAPDCVEKIVLSSACADEFRRLSQFFGYNDYQMFPDVQGLVDYIEQKI